MNGMLLPRYTIRTLLIVTFNCAVISVLLRQAILGRAWAIGVSTAIGTAVVLLVAHILLFAVANVFVAMRSASRKPVVGASPFASAGLPRQIVAPVDPE